MKKASGCTVQQPALGIMCRAAYAVCVIREALVLGDDMTQAGRANEVEMWTMRPCAQALRFAKAIACVVAHFWAVQYLPIEAMESDWYHALSLPKK